MSVVKLTQPTNDEEIPGTYQNQKHNLNSYSSLAHTNDIRKPRELSEPKVYCSITNKKGVHIFTVTKNKGDEEN